MGNANFCLHFGVGKIKIKKFKAVFRLNATYACQKYCQIHRCEKRMVCVCIYIYMYMCVYIYIYTHIHKGKSVPLQAWSGPVGSRNLRFPDFMTTAHDGGKVVSLKHRPPLPPGNAPGTHICYRLSRSQGQSAIGRILYQRKIPMTPAGIETATFRFVA